jgi:hypothetical protein
VTLLQAPTYADNVATSSAPGSGRLRLFVIWVLIVTSLVPWRVGEYFSGGVDPVVLSKGMLSIAALVLAGYAARRGELRPVGVRSLCLIGSYIAVTTIGGWAAGSLLSSLLLSVRVLIVAATVLLALMAHPVAGVVRAMCAAMATVGLVSAAAGVGTLPSGRLSGGIFPLNPNELAVLLGPAAIGLMWRLTRSRAHRYDLVLLILLVGLTWLTGSRTGLAALAVGLIVVVIQARRLPVGGFIGVVALVPVVGYVLLSTSLVSKYFERGGAANISSLNSRTIAWRAAFALPTDFWQHWFGAGLAVKTIGVSGTFWSTQVVDSSWVSAYVQAGVLGLAVLSLWALVTLVSAFRAPQPWRPLWVALVVFILIQSVLMSGLIDSHVLFLVMFLVSVASERATSVGPRSELTAARGLPDGGGHVTR